MNQLKHLKKDKTLAGIIETQPPFEWAATGKLFEDLLRAIVGQQLSVKAAASIWSRFENVLDNKITHTSVLATPDDRFREAGLSWSKIKYIKGVSEAYKNHEIDESKIAKMGDEEIVVELTKLKGVGRWTVEMILIFTLNRQDVFSLGDLGLRSAVARQYGVDRDDLKAIGRISDKWRPYRSLACRYLWKSLDNAPK